MAKVVLILEDGETLGDLSITLTSEPHLPTDEPETQTIAQSFGVAAMAHLQTLLEQHGGMITRSCLG